jgi:hypothetical protein
MRHLQLPMLPVSTNHAYGTVKLVRGSKRYLTKEGKKFKNEATAHLTKKYAFVLQGMEPNRPYSLFYRFTITDLLNVTWPKGAATRYKHADTTNRFKLLEDVLSEVTAVDDSHFHAIGGVTVQGPKELTDVWIWDVEKEGSPLDALNLSL